MKKVAVVTGASEGLGLAISQRLTAEGNRVIAICRTEPKGFEYYKWLPWDLAKPELLTPALLESELGNQIEIFIANAGILKGISPARYTFEDIRHIQDIHVTSHVLLANHLAEYMKKHRKGRVVFIGSTAGVTGHPDVMYAATKAALAALAKSYANIYKHDNVTFNCLQPGAMKTKITKAMPQENREYLGENTLIAGSYLDIDSAVDVTMNLVGEENHINGAAITIGDNAVWR